jgi:hypothetical protein
MKKIKLAFFGFTLLLLSGGFMPLQLSSLQGAWHAQNGSIETVALFQDGYFSITYFDKNNKKFIRTFGGTYNESGGQLHTDIEFDTDAKDNVGKHYHYTYSLSGNSLSVNLSGQVVTFSRTDDGTGELAGNWRITGRMQNGQMQEIKSEENVETAFSYPVSMDSHQYRNQRVFGYRRWYVHFC